MSLFNSVITVFPCYSGRQNTDSFILLFRRLHIHPPFIVFMPYCFCTSHGCGNTLEGRSVHARTLNVHTLDDAAAMARKTQDVATEVADVEPRDITSHVLAATLANRVSGPSKITGGRLWLSPDPSDLSSDTFSEPMSQSHRVEAHDSRPCHSSSTHGDRSRCFNVDELLRSLSDVDRSVKALTDNVSSKLTCLHFPAEDRCLSFPLKQLQSQSASFREDLEIVMNKHPRVEEFKRSILEQLDEVDKKLRIAKNNWTKRQREYRAPDSGVFVETSTDAFLVDSIVLTML